MQSESDVTQRPWDPAVEALAGLVRGWFGRTLRMRPSERRERVRRLSDALEAAAELSHRQLGPKAPMTRRFTELEQQIRAAGGSKAGLARLAPSVATALGGVSSALVYLEPEIDAEHAAFEDLMDRVAPDGDSVWVDLGCGAGATIAALEQRYPSSRFLGVELEGVDAPAHVVRLPREPDPGVLSELTVAQLGPGSATHASLIYPLHGPLQDASGRRRLAHLWQLDTVLAILRAGGHGLLVTEDPVAWGAALGHLSEHAGATDVVALPEPIGCHQLLARGLVPYTPTVRDLHSVRPPPQLTWGLAIGWRAV